MLFSYHMRALNYKPDLHADSRAEKSLRKMHKDNRQVAMFRVHTEPFPKSSMYHALRITGELADETFAGAAVVLAADETFLIELSLLDQMSGMGRIMCSIGVNQAKPFFRAFECGTQSICIERFVEKFGCV